MSSKKKLFDDFFVSLHESIDDINELWNEASPNDDMVLSSDYLRILEQNPSLDGSHLYALIHKGDQAIGCLYFQSGLFKAKDSVNIKSNGIYSKVVNAVAKRVNVPTLVVGNLYFTGDHSFHYSLSLDEAIQWKLNLGTLEAVKEYYKKKGITVGLVLLKDFYDPQIQGASSPENSQFCNFPFEPSMEFYIRESWESFDDYLGAVRSKYRVKIKSALKSLGEVEIREMSHEEMVDKRIEISNLHRSVRENASFNLLFIPDMYFEECKRCLDDKFTVFGFYKGEELIAFQTLIDNNSVLEAHFLGYSMEHNRQHKLYLNMLLNAIDFGIKNKFKTINFARTAIEIKSFIGAQPVNMLCYLRHENKTLNRFLPKVTALLDTSKEYTFRSPFKE